MDSRLAQLAEEEKKYTISKYEHLKYFEEGDTIHPAIKSSIASCRSYLNNTLKEEKADIEELMEKDANDRCAWLIKHNRYILIRDKDWDKIFTDIEENPDSFQRYYPLFRLRMENNNLIQMVIAFLMNDDLYAYSKVLAEKKED